MSQVTKKALAAALKDQLLKKPLHKITINDITEECGINRMTFYYHFKDIYDLVEWTMLKEPWKGIKPMIPGSRDFIISLRRYYRISHLL